MLRITRALRNVLLLAALVVVSLARAQDVTVGGLTWSGSAPETFPVLDSHGLPEYPEEFKNTDTIGYVIVTAQFDASGNRQNLAIRGSHPPFQRSVEAVVSKWKMTPAKKAGQTLAGKLTVAVLFNPKSADATSPNATARLLHVAPLAPTTRLGRMQIDEKGTATAFDPHDPVNETFTMTVRGYLRLWRFAPARKDGVAVASSVELLMLGERVTTPPKVISQKPPVYPFVMRQFGLRGQVTVDFTVDEKGAVRNAFPIETDNPAFEEPALEAIRTWKFMPGTADGKPIATHMRVPIHFDLEGAPGGGNNAFVMAAQGERSKLPPELQFDTPPKLRAIIVPVYPYAQRRDRVRGEAQAGVLISPQGRVAAVNVLKADVPEFGLALAAALEGFKFEPALKDGKPVSYIFNFTQAFNSRELPDDAGDDLLSVEKKHPERIVEISSLDGPMKPISRRPPVYPTDPEAGPQGGEAVVECIIDEDGRVRLPRIMSASHPAFGYAAVQASSTWWFEPPMKAGKPIAVHARIPFKFAALPVRPVPASPSSK